MKNLYLGYVDWITSLDYLTAEEEIKFLESKISELECGATNHEFAVDESEFGEYQTKYPPGSFAYSVVRFDGEINGYSISDSELISFSEKDERYTDIYIL